MHFKSAESQLMSRPWAQGEGISNCVCVCGGWVGAACVSVSPTDSLPLFTPSSPYRFRECQQLPFLPALACFLTSSWDHSPFCPSLMPSPCHGDRTGHIWLLFLNTQFPFQTGSPPATLVTQLGSLMAATSDRIIAPSALGRSLPKTTRILFH